MVKQIQETIYENPNIQIFLENIYSLHFTRSWSLEVLTHLQMLESVTTSTIPYGQKV